MMSFNHLAATLVLKLTKDFDFHDQTAIFFSILSHDIYNVTSRHNAISSPFF